MITSPFSPQYSWSVDNFGLFINDSSGTSLIFPAGANTKGSDANVLAGIAEDCYFISVCFLQGSGAASSDNFMCDVKIDPNAGVGNNGTTYNTIIPNLLSRGPTMNFMGGCWYGFPLFIPKGSAIGAAAQQSASGGGNYNIVVRLYGKPNRPELIRTGSQVQAIGANTATTLGTAFTPGTSAKGSWSSSLGTLSAPSWWWQLGISVNNTTQSLLSYLFDVSFDATSHEMALLDMPYYADTSENNGFQCGQAGGVPPVSEAPAGADVFIRGAAAGTPNTGVSGVVYVVQD